jgi:peptide/nickel transport system ATP-binding protein
MVRANTLIRGSKRVLAKPSMLNIDNLSLQYRSHSGLVQALSNVSIKVRKGSTLAIVGESGSGKSTIALAAMGLLPNEAQISNGSILFDGQDILMMTPEQRRHVRGAQIGLVFQDPFAVLNPSLTVGDQVSEGLIYHLGLSKTQALARAIELLDEVGIARPAIVAKAYPHELSGGMRQRALIAGALAAEPQFLILDEPTTALDVTIEAQILDLLQSLQAQRSLTMLFISHNLGVVKRVADEVAVLYAGEIIEQGATTEVLFESRHPYTKGLIAAVPSLRNPKIGPLASIAGRLPDLRVLPTGCRFAPRCPFVTTGCDSVQTLTRLEQHHLVRCHASAALRHQPWPASAAPTQQADITHSSKTIVEAKNLQKTFRQSTGKIYFKNFLPKIKYDEHHAVDQVSLKIRAGEVLGLVGESGSGKTTLGRTILRLLEPTSGEIIIDGKNISQTAQSQLTDMRRCAQIVFQNPDSSLNPRKTVRQLLTRPIERFQLVSHDKIPARIHNLLDLVRLPHHYADRYPHQMSGGEKQRVSIACALATEPRFIVCDEPVSALDVSVQAAIVNLLSDLRDRLQVAYLFISHDISVVAHLADRIAVMKNGQIIEIGDARTIIEQPSHPYTIKLLSAVPSLERRSSAY